MLDSIEMRTARVTIAMLFVLNVFTTLYAQDRDILYVSGPEFNLSERAIAAGIDGTLTVSFKVDRGGTVKNVTILAGPIWPCDSSPESVIKEVR